MDKKEQIIEIISKIEKLASELRALVHKDIATVSLRGEKSIKHEKRNIGTSDLIKRLIDSRFFSSSKSVIEVSNECKKRAIPHNKDVIAMALMRLVRKGLLIRDGEGTIKSPWKYKNYS